MIKKTPDELQLSYNKILLKNSKLHLKTKSLKLKTTKNDDLIFYNYSTLALKT